MQHPNVRYIDNFQLHEELFYNLKRSIKLYISRALHFNFYENDQDFLQRLDENKDNRLNVTPNGAVVPKKEYVFEYNALDYLQPYVLMHDEVSRMGL